MTDRLTSKERNYLNGWWRMYDAADSDEERLSLRSIIELYITGATMRRVTDELVAFHKRYHNPQSLG